MTQTYSGEPDYLAQTAEQLSVHQRFDWLAARASDAKKAGCNYLRAAITEHQGEKITLMEGWHRRPEEDGPPRFQYEAVPA